MPDQEAACMYHSGTAMYRYAAKMGLLADHREHESVRRVVKMAIALALLPPRIVAGGLEV